MKTQIFKTLSISVALLLMPITLCKSVALKNINIVDVENERVLTNMAVIIENERIVKIVSSDKFDSTDDLQVVNLSGKYVIPGLIDGHVHHATDPDLWDDMETTLKRLKSLLRGGVTTVRDMGGDTRVLAYLKRQARLNKIQSPDIHYSVIIGGPTFFEDPRTISSAKGYEAGTTPWMRSVTDDSSFDSVILQAIGNGATGIKIYADVSGEQIQLLSDAAKKHGIKVWGHSFVGPDLPSKGSMRGIEVLSHVPDLSGEFISDFKNWRRKKGKVKQSELEQAYRLKNYDELFSMMKERGVILDATLLVFHQSREKTETRKHLYKLAVALTRYANESGVTISAGTDAFSTEEKPYARLYDELYLLVDDAGLTPFQALTSATLNNAKVLGLESEIGSIEIGKVANLVILDENPTRNIKAVRKVNHVIKYGKFVYLGAETEQIFDDIDNL